LPERFAEKQKTMSSRAKREICSLRSTKQNAARDKLDRLMPGANQSIDIRSALKQGMAQLRAAETASHTLAAEVLLMHAINQDRAWLYSHPEGILDPAAAEKYCAFIARRAAGEPTQYITGKQEFWGLEFEVTPAVLIPRPETEHVMEVALARLGERGFKIHLDTGAPRKILDVADIGTGSGCLAVALAYELPHAQIMATDISPAALEVARRNAARHTVPPHNLVERIQFVETDLLPSLPAGNQSPRFDLIVSNPPYIADSESASLQREVREHEPHRALFAGPTGVEVYARIIDEAERQLRDRGIIVVELGHNSAEPVRALFDATSSSWTNLSITMDLAGIPRVLAAERAR
jgi:release factor glutamine methyltransferase